MTFVSQRCEVPADLSLEAAHFRVVADDELGGRPDANARHDGVGGRITRRERLFDGVVQFV
jgi:hypothetical protein